MRTDPLLVGATLIALLAPAASADTLRVPKDFATIQEAVDAAVPDDTIVVSKGTYAPFTVFDKTDITIRGKGKPVLDGAAALTPVVEINGGSTNVELIGFRISNGGDRGVNVTNAAAIVISKCRFEDIDGPGIVLAGTDHFVQKCQIIGTGSVGVLLEDGSTNITIEKCLMEDTDSAINMFGSGHTISKNRVKDSRNEGFTILSTDSLIEKNRFDGVDDDALDVEGDDNTFVKNRIKHVGSNGVELQPADGDPFVVTGNTFEKNKVSHADENGFFVETAGNTFIKNKASKNEAFDLLDTAGDGANVYEGNKFGTEQFE